MDAPLFEVIDRGDEMGQRTTESIEFPDREGITSP
jgi:hypothetical protein